MGFLRLLIASVTLNVTANILLKKGVMSFGGISASKAELLTSLTKAASSPFIIGGLVLYGLSFVIWLRVLSFNDLSRTYPIFASVVFLMTTLGSIKFLNEDVSIMRFVGIAVMLAGIFIVARS